jgi:glycine betaine transporter
LLIKLIHQYRKNSLIFYGLLFGLAFFFTGILFPHNLIAILNDTNITILSVFSNYYLWVGLFIVLVSLGILLLPISKKKLGDVKPEYSYFSWLALLYSTGMGSGLLLRAVQEPVYYFNNLPVSIANAKQISLQFTYFHWGFTPWAMYSLFGLILAYNLYVKKVPNLLNSIIPYTNKIIIKNTAIVFIVLITITGVIASLGLGTAQFIGGLNQYFNLNLGNIFLLLTVFSIGLIATLSALTGIKRVIKYLADFDMIFSIILMVFIASYLNFTSFFSQTFSAFYNYAIHFFEMSLASGGYNAIETFTQNWTVFYWAFWLAWVPFTGIFISRISKGRTIREFIIATILVPTLATILWFSVFANQAFNIISDGDAHQFDNLFTSLFVFLQHFPLSQITVILATTLVLIAIINSVDSAIFVLGMFSDEGNENPSNKHKFIWGIIITATSLGLTAVGANDLLSAISNLLIIMALPFSFLYMYIILNFIFNLFKQKAKDETQ